MKVQGAKYWKDRKLTDKDRDWTYGDATWVKDYNKSIAHPHRQILINLLGTFAWSSLLELGCSTGPNLKLIHNNYPLARLTGIDVNKDSVVEAKKFLGKAVYVTEKDLHSMTELGQTYDVVLADASLMYVSAKEINGVMDDLVSMANRVVIIVDRFNRSKAGVSHYIWSRNYKALMKERGLDVTEIKLDKTTWPSSVNWQKFGYVWLGIK